MPRNVTDFHREAVVVDCHNDLILVVERQRAMGQPDDFARYWLGELRAGGVDVQVLPVYLEDEYRPDGGLRRAMKLLAAIRRVARDNAGDVALCTTGAEIDTAISAGKIALVAALEGCEAVGTDIDLFEPLYALGIRIVSFTHFGRTALADGSGEDATYSRLTKDGVAAVAELERLGIVMDVSHLSESGTAHVLEVATRPVIASHSCVRDLCDHHRNLRDDAIRGIAATGGVIGINLFPGFIDKKDPTIERVVDHMDHIATLVGSDHIGIGSDFLREYFDDVYANYPDLTMEGLGVTEKIDGLAYSHELPNLTAALTARGWTDDDVAKVLGGNFLRVFREVMV